MLGGRRARSCTTRCFHFEPGATKGAGIENHPSAPHMRTGYRTSGQISSSAHVCGSRRPIAAENDLESRYGVLFRVNEREAVSWHGKCRPSVRSAEPRNERRTNFDLFPAPGTLRLQAVGSTHVLLRGRFDSCRLCGAALRSKPLFFCFSVEAPPTRGCPRRRLFANAVANDGSFPFVVYSLRGAVNSLQCNLVYRSSPVRAPLHATRVHPGLNSREQTLSALL